MTPHLVIGFHIPGVGTIGYQGLIADLPDLVTAICFRLFNWPEAAVGVTPVDRSLSASSSQHPLFMVNVEDPMMRGDHADALVQAMAAVIVPRVYYGYQWPGAPLDLTLLPCEIIVMYWATNGQVAYVQKLFAVEELSVAAATEQGLTPLADALQSLRPES